VPPPAWPQAEKNDAAETRENHIRFGNVNMGERKGFTLIELLVVISIIALLLSLLVPALDKAKIRAKNSVCLSNLHQLALAVSMYALEHDGDFVVGCTGATGGWAWMEKLRPYYKDDRLLICPVTKIVNERDYSAGGAFRVWNPGTVDNPLFGSYGLNGWLSKPEPGRDSVFGRPVRDNWQTIDIKGAGRVPMMVGCGIWDSWPLHTDQPPPYENTEVIHGVLNNEVRRFCMNRHQSRINGSFVDIAARPIGLKELWRIKWHRRYDTGAVAPLWPEWMKNMKDY
jgi:prepilin-type N-terminal cleavage/methylation domain-containing protein